MDTLAYAIKMEVDGEQYYRNQAEKNADNALGQVFEFLANAERKHADLLRERSEKSSVELKKLAANEKDNLFNYLDDFKNDVTSIPKQLHVYQMALDIEKKSVALYTDMLEKADEGSDQTLLRFLIEQEKQHEQLFDTLVTLVQRPEEWVEDAEFGPREEY